MILKKWKNKARSDLRVCEMKVSLSSPMDLMPLLYLPGFTHTHKHAEEAVELLTQWEEEIPEGEVEGNTERVEKILGQILGN